MFLRLMMTFNMLFIYFNWSKLFPSICTNCTIYCFFIILKSIFWSIFLLIFTMMISPVIMHSTQLIKTHLSTIYRASIRFFICMYENMLLEIIETAKSLSTCFSLEWSFFGVNKSMSRQLPIIFTNFISEFT